MVMTQAAPDAASGGRLIGSLPLQGGGGEPVDLTRTLASHGVATLPPQLVESAAGTLETTLAVPDGHARTIRIRPGRPGQAAVEVLGDAPPGGADGHLLATARRLLKSHRDHGWPTVSAPITVCSARWPS
jgi:hypothetical protein